MRNRFFLFTKSAVIAAVGFFVIAGSATYPVARCNMKTCCMMPDFGGDFGIHQGPCGCGCGEYQEPQEIDQSAVITAIAEINPLPTSFDYIVENDNNISGELIPQYIEREEFSHSPPLIPDNRYTPLLC